MKKLLLVLLLMTSGYSAQYIPALVTDTLRINKLFKDTSLSGARIKFDAQGIAHRDTITAIDSARVAGFAHRVDSAGTFFADSICIANGLDVPYLNHASDATIYSSADILPLDNGVQNLGSYYNRWNFIRGYTIIASTGFTGNLTGTADSAKKVYHAYVMDSSISCKRADSVIHPVDSARKVNHAYVMDSSISCKRADSVIHPVDSARKVNHAYVMDSANGAKYLGGSLLTAIPLLAGRAGGQTLIGGTAETNALTLQGTSGNGTLTSAAINMNVGNAGGTNAMTILGNGNIGIGSTVTSPTARLQLPAGTATAGTAPLKLMSGTLLTAPEVGALEFLTDDLYFTNTTGTARKMIVQNDGTALTATRIPVITTNGRLTDNSTFTITTNAVGVDSLTSAKKIKCTGINSSGDIAGTTGTYSSTVSVDSLFSTKRIKSAGLNLTGFTTSNDSAYFTKGLKTAGGYTAATVSNLDSVYFAKGIKTAATATSLKDSTVTLQVTGTGSADSLYTRSIYSLSMYSPHYYLYSKGSSPEIWGSFSAVNGELEITSLTNYLVLRGATGTVIGNNYPPANFANNDFYVSGRSYAAGHILGDTLYGRGVKTPNLSMLDSTVLGAEMHTSANAASDPNANEANATTGWELVGGGTFTSSSTSPEAGTYCLKSVAANVYQGMRYPITAIIGHIYKISFWAKRGVTGSTGSQCSKSWEGVVTSPETGLIPASWTNYVYYVTANATTLKVVFYSWYTGGGLANDELYVDNVSIKDATGLPPIYANNAAAVAGNLKAGVIYRTGGDPDLLCIVH